MGVPSPPPLPFPKLFSRSSCGRIFPLYSRVMRGGLFTYLCAKWAKSVLSAGYSPDLLTEPVSVIGSKALVMRYSSERRISAVSQVHPDAEGTEIEPLSCDNHRSNQDCK